MSENTIEKEGAFTPRDHYIDCPKYSGSRCAACCVFYDRYKACRRHCASLRKHLLAYPDLPDKARAHFEDRRKNERTLSHGLLEELYKAAGTNLPTERFGCQMCKFIAKSERGLRVHMRRTHKCVSKN